MGRNRDSYWASRRALRSYRARLAERVVTRDYAFDREALIEGERGRVCLEQILTPPEDTPLAAWRVISRWAGPLAAGSVITVSDKRLVVLRVRPMDGRRMVAHILCRDAAAQSHEGQCPALCRDSQIGALDRVNSPYAASSGTPSAVK